MKYEYPTDIDKIKGGSAQYRLGLDLEKTKDLKSKKDKLKRVNQLAKDYLDKTDLLKTDIDNMVDFIINNGHTGSVKNPAFVTYLSEESQVACYLDTHNIEMFALKNRNIIYCNGKDWGDEIYPKTMYAMERAFVGFDDKKNKPFKFSALKSQVKAKQAIDHIAYLRSRNILLEKLKENHDKHQHLVKSHEYRKETLMNMLSECLSLRPNHLSEYNLEIARFASYRILVSMVTLQRYPGIPIRNHLMLIGDSGAGKSALVRNILPYELRKIYYQPEVNFQNMDELVYQIRGRAYGEVAEMVGMRKAPAAKVKSFLAQDSLSARLKYAKNESSIPYTMVCIGTSNEYDSPLPSDPVLAQRWIPVWVDRKKIKDVHEKGMVESYWDEKRGLILACAYEESLFMHPTRAAAENDLITIKDENLRSKIHARCELTTFDPDVSVPISIENWIINKPHPRLGYDSGEIAGELRSHCAKDKEGRSVYRLERMISEIRDLKEISHSGQRVKKAMNQCGLDKIKISKGIHKGCSGWAIRHEKLSEYIEIAHENMKRWGAGQANDPVYIPRDTP